MSIEKVSLVPVPAGKLQCVITGELRPDKPEEHVRQRFARSLLEVYNYRKSDIEIEYSVKMGSGRKRADIVIFPPNVEHRQDNASIIIEVKREDVRPTDQKEGVDQLKSYLAATLNSTYGVWVGSELHVLQKVDLPTGREYWDAADIPSFGSRNPKHLTIHDLVPADSELTSILRRCHNYIYGNQGLQKEPAFHELLKLIFCKVHDESESTGDVKFYISNEDKRTTIGQRNLQNTIKQLFEEVHTEYPYIFPPTDKIELEPRVLAYIVGELQRYSLRETTADFKGAAYEQLVGANLRGDRGEYFTPRAVCQMAVDMVLATYPENRQTNLRCIDPSCGTGGFLRQMIVSWNETIQSQQEKRWRNNPERAKSEIKERLHDVASRNLFGIDFNPTLVRAAQMNLVMHGDGSSNIYHANSLLPTGEWPNEGRNAVRDNIQMSSFDVVITNPPFGSQIPIDDPHILSGYDISTYSADSRRTSMPPEQLFIERGLRLLKPGGRMAIVLPDSILSNPGLVWLRKWILKECRLLASIDLPAVTFEPYTGTQTSVLLLQRKTIPDLEIERRIGKGKSYEVFMSTPESVGKDRRGNTVYVRTPTGEEIEYEREVNGRTVREKIEYNQLVEVVRQFRYWLSQHDRMSWINE